MLTGSLAAPGLAAAAGDDLAVREDKALRAYAAATDQSQRHGRYRQARALLLTQEGNITTRVEAWEKATQQWVLGWYKVMALADLQKDIPYTQFEAELQQLLRVQHDGLLQLSNDAKSVKASADMALELLGPANPGTTPAEIGEYASVLQALTQRENELRTAITQLSAIPTSRMARLETLAQTSRQIILTRVRVALLKNARYPLEQTLASVQALLTAEQVVDPVLAALTRAENDMNRFALNLQVYHVEEALAQGRTLCTSSQAKLAALTSPAAYVAQARSRATQLCSALEAHASGLLSYGIPKADLVYESIAVEKASLRTICKSAQPPVACEKLAILAALTLPDLQSMNDAKLRFVEYGWSELFKAATHP
ncbi:hypothetical protein BON30_32395 [Cystobacter ferrugineus]|uniref:Uncharacterized protein n=1 Tax=Cystobacter ferrugineus TaxID=83449 RepID=A0A1L9B2I4_9BACT|nr:hypothetical protein BON30_32395 [Cystobacter ferrugineus]